MSLSAPPPGMQHLPVRGARTGPPLWAGILVLLAAPVMLEVATIAVAAPLLREDIAIEQIDNGARVQVEADGDYFVLTTTAGASACTVTLPEGSKVGLTPPARAKRSIRSAGAQYAMQGFFTPDRSGKARIRCLGAGEQIGVAQWPGDYERAVNLGRWTGYAAIACLVGGIAMIVFRGRKPRYY
ncbi:MAG: hypothetical protein R2731_12695 [Nocardioides sp.]